jgi:hypothetical protein
MIWDALLLLSFFAFSQTLSLFLVLELTVNRPSVYFAAPRVYCLT